MRGWWLPLLAALVAFGDDNNGTGPGTPPESPNALSSVSLDGAVVWPPATGPGADLPDSLLVTHDWSEPLHLAFGSCRTSVLVVTTIASYSGSTSSRRRLYRDSSLFSGSMRCARSR